MELTLGSGVVSGETVTVGYTVPVGAEAAPLRDAAGNAAAGFAGEAVTNETSAPENSAPTGRPTIGGTAQVGATLTASVDGIADADGLDDVTFGYQWLADDTEIGGATGTTHEVAPEQAGRTLRVRVTFTDKGGTQEALTSVATPVVAESGPLPAVSIAPGASPKSEGAQAAFTLTRTGDVTDALTVTVSVTETGAALDGAGPSDPTFPPGAARVAIVVGTVDDEVVEDASAVAAALVTGDGYAVRVEGASATVTVEDDDAAPVVATASALAVAENATAVATLEATDEDTDLGSLAWSIAGGADAGAFTLTEAGALSFQRAKDFEAPDDADGDGTYEVTVRVTDGANSVDAAVTVSLTDVEEVIPALTVASVNGTTLTLTFSGALDATSKPPADAFAVTVAGDARTVTEVALSGSAVELTLASAVASGETVTVGYAVPTGAEAALLKDAAGNAVAGFTGETVTNETAAPANTAPTGLPGITGTAKVGEVLTASTDGIADEDGLDGETFAYRWLVNDGTDDTEIEGATGTTREVAPAEVGKTLKVRVTFTDGGGTEETLTSAATVPVAARAPDAPGGLAAAAAAGREGELDVSWTAPESDGGAEVTGYKVQWKSGSEAWDGTASSSRQAAVSDPAVLSHRITGLTVGTAYTVRVMAVNVAGDGAATETTATAEDRVVPALASASVNGTALTLTFSEALDAASKPAADAFAVTVAGTARTVDAVALSGSAVELTLSRGRVWRDGDGGLHGAGGRGRSAAPDAAGNAVAGFSGESVTNETPAPANTAPTGLPEITGTAKRG